MNTGEATVVDKHHEEGKATGGETATPPKGGTRAPPPGRRPDHPQTDGDPIAKLTERVGAAESAMSARNGTLDALGRDVKKLKEEMKDAREQGVEIAKLPEELAAFKASIEQRLAKAKVAKAEGDAPVFVTEAQFVELSGRVEEVEKLSSKLLDIEGKLADVDLKALAKSAREALTMGTTLDEKLAALEELKAIKALSEQIGTLKAELAAEQGKVTALQGKVVESPTFKSLMRVDIAGPVKIGHVVGSVAVYGLWQAVARWGLPMVKPEWSGLQTNIWGNVASVAVGVGGAHWAMNRG